MRMESLPRSVYPRPGARDRAFNLNAPGFAPLREFLGAI